MRTPAVAEAEVPEWVPPVPRRAPGGEPTAPPGPAPAFGTLEWRFPALPVHARMARVWLEAWMSDRGLDSETAYRAAVAFSEVVTNAVLHGSGLITVRARIVPGTLECEVGDGAADLPIVYEAGVDDEHHRGLSLVDALTDDWRVSARPGGGKTVAFTVRAGEGETADPDPALSLPAAAATTSAEPRAVPPGPRTDPDASGVSAC
jgi:anti-sigma regulatory factor (Ser/Thr protein kinase)